MPRVETRIGVCGVAALANGTTHWLRTAPCIHPILVSTQRAVGRWAHCHVVGHLHGETMPRSLRLASHPNARRRGVRFLLR